MKGLIISIVRGNKVIKIYIGSVICVYYFVYRIGVAEKGYITLELSVQTSAGHSSMPPRESSIGILSNAVAK